MAGRNARSTPRPVWMFAVAGGVVGILVVAVVMIMRSQRHDTIILEVSPALDPSFIRVYVGGGVTTPGIYVLSRGSRVSDAIDAAGGLAPGADTSSLGKAATLEDSDQIIVALANPAPASNLVNGSEPGTTPVSSDMPAGSSSPININTADAAELETLPGIGPALAERIVEFRTENGPFQTIDELEAVRGISLAMVEELRPLIALGP